MKCKLCKKNEADQTGSHITSAFLLTSQIGKRGQEKGFLLTTNPDQNYSINQGDIGIKEDYIFCRDCEKRLGIVEGIYATEITQKIEQKKFEQNFNKTTFENGNYKLESKKITSIAFQLLMQSNIWRASISELELYAHFKLSEELEDRMRNNLDLFLPNVIKHKILQTEKEWIKMTENCKDFFDIIPIAIIKAENIENKDLTYEFFDNISKQPYHIILNEYFIFIFGTSLDWNDDFFDLKEEFDLNEIIINGFDHPTLGVIQNEKYFDTINKIQALAVKERIHQIEKQSIAELLRNGIKITQESLKEMIIKKAKEITPN
jgi:hypothetical protein